MYLVRLRITKGYLDAHNKWLVIIIRRIMGNELDPEKKRINVMWGSTDRLITSFRHKGLKMMDLMESCNPNPTQVSH